MELLNYLNHYKKHITNILSSHELHFYFTRSGLLEFIKSGISYEELLELYKTSLDSQKQMAEDLKQMQQILNDNFKVTKNAPSTQEDEIEQYLSSSNSLTGRLLEKYEKEKR